MQVEEREGHGWWPYVVPYVVFILLSQFGPRFPESIQTALVGLKPAIVLGLVLWFLASGAYPEWRRPPNPMSAGGFALDVLVGLGLTAVWVAPYLLIPGLKPEPGGEFDPALAGERWIGWMIGLRLFGYALVTPIFEELFVRSFVLRIADVWETEFDFRDQPIARYSRKGLLVSTIVFTAGHQPWEYWVCVPWVLLSTLWFYHRRNLSALIIVHGTTNGALLALAVFGEGWLRDIHGAPFSFWFFV
ncbi:CPBP family intramembrane metalloprotease [Myxococcota bacterium]|nr:CPBP family intramembrane metalloprotease [Myxococcota bacterium]